ncbi:S41 family peptidase [Mucilaginibacter lacusdianchii]|uniref:S41 family peptidase n=1 Tax=Mucilaginibacter lacusdianchii TaxID=2684211 RepID=UPI00131B7AE3|nr:S41 family peptidase [Mucilaginibacter sp. JXJ CY 39]
MKNLKLTMAFLCLLATALCKAQPNAPAHMAAAAIPFNQQSLENTYLLGRVWGLLKYFHPAVATGQDDWDAELFKKLALVNCSNQAFNEDLSRWITSLGPTVPCRSCQPTITDSLLARNRWITNTSFTKETSSLLRQVIMNRNTGKNKYVRMISFFQNPDFGTENAYRTLKDIDVNYRLLCLFRFWNMVAYYFPYKDLIGEDWDNALKAMIPEFINAQTPLAYKLAAWRMIDRIHDTHANLYSNYSDQEMLNFMGGPRQLPVIILRVEDQYVVAGLRDSINYPQLQLGDVILKIDGQSVTERAEKLMPYACASNQITAYRNVGLNLLRSKQDTIHLQIVRKGKLIDLHVPSLNNQEFGQMVLQAAARAEKQLPYRLLNPQVGYVRFDMTHSNFVKEMFDSFKATKGMVVDLRNYPAVSVNHLLRKYLNERPVTFAKFKYTDTSHPSLFINEKEQTFGAINKKPYQGKVVVLVNEQSQSNAEFVAMALRACKRVVIMGSQTAGADGNISRINLPGGLYTYFSGIGVYYPDGSGTQRIGIVPDMEVKPTLKGLSEGRDELLEKAMTWLAN